MGFCHYFHQLATMTETMKEENDIPNSLIKSPHKCQFQQQEDEGLKKLLVIDISSLPPSPPSVVETNFVWYFAPGQPFLLNTFEFSILFWLDFDRFCILDWLIGIC